MTTKAPSATAPYPHVTADPAISGGKVVIQGTRIPVSTLIRAHQLGMDFDEILVQYPGLRPEQLHAAFVYYFDHQTEVDASIREQQLAPAGATTQNG